MKRLHTNTGFAAVALLALILGLLVGNEYGANTARDSLRRRFVLVPRPPANVIPELLPNDQKNAQEKLDEARDAWREVELP